jgi:RNA polymerase primary sigma factor
MNRAARRLQELLGREPTDEELADDLGIKPARVAMMRMAATRPTSLDAPVGDADNGTFAEVVRDENADDPFEELQAKGVTGMLKDLVTNLTNREANILRARYGLDGGRMKTLEEIGAEWGITRERARQVQNNALRKLRSMIEKLEKSKVRN